MKNNYTLVIGLEIHAQLQTKSKMFCADAVQFGTEPNSLTSPISLGHPGAMPVVNKKAVEFAIKMGLACGCKINELNYFDRKNYFYPDLPKGYQTTQDKAPICVGGAVEIRSGNGEKKTVRLNRIHMEEDAGKLIHLEGNADSFIDLNRAGTPLIEIVTEPDLRSAGDASTFLMAIRKLVRYLEICDGNMEEGSFRCDANVSVMPTGSTEYGKKVEIKNMNSFRFVQKAIDFEFSRQCNLLENGAEILSETRMFNAETGETYAMRSKETMNDYRYFPDPDLQPIFVDEKWLNSIREKMPPLPAFLFEKFTSHYLLTENDATFLTENRETALYFEALCLLKIPAKISANWLMGTVRSFLKENNLEMNQFPISASSLGELIQLVLDNTISHTIAAGELFNQLVLSPETPPINLAEKLNLFQNSDEAFLKEAIDKILLQMPDKVAAYKSGKKGLLGLFMGELKKVTQGKADPRLSSQLLERALN
jgi:aspartyl-tRNA(Asn)/glutamyl-tRNA(Gln) amidotransferase subunit B